MIPDLLFLALDFYRNPRRFDHLRDPNAPLPANLTELLSASSNSLSAENLAATAAALNATEAECLACVPFFIKQVLLEPQGDFFRVLGLPHTARQEKIKEHYRYLIRIFHPDKDVNGEGWNDRYAPRINEAYNTLRTIIQRAHYESELAKAASAVGAGNGETAGGATRATDVTTDAAGSGEAAADWDNGSASVSSAAMAGGAGHAAAGNFTSTGSVSSASVLRKPWFYALVFGAAIFLLLGLLLSSNNSPQLIIAAQPEGQGRVALPDETTAVLEPDKSEQQTVAVVQDQPASVSPASANQRIEELVSERVAQARQAVLGAPEEPVRAEPKPEPEPAPVVEEVVAAVEADVAVAQEVVAEPKAVPAPAPKVTPKPEPQVIAAAPVSKPAAPAKAEVAVVAAAVQSDTEVVSPPASRPEPERVVQAEPVAEPEPERVVQAEPVAEPEPERVVQAEPERVAVSEPSPEPEIISQSEPAPAPAPAPVPAEPLPEAITTEQLNTLLASFSAQYEAMDATAFAALFTTDAHTSETDGRSGIQNMYVEFFGDTAVEGFSFSKVVWQPQQGASRSGSALATIVTRPAAGGRRNTVKATIAFEAQRGADNSLQISRMTY